MGRRRLRVETVGAVLRPTRVGRRGLPLDEEAGLIAEVERAEHDDRRAGDDAGDDGREEPDQVQFHVANRDLFGQDYKWLPKAELKEQSRPAAAV